MNDHICSSCEKTYNKDQRDRIISNISQSIDETLIENLCLDCVKENLRKECGASYIKIKELQKAHAQAKLQYQQTYQAWKDSIDHYEQHDHSLALINHLIAQDNKPKTVVRKSTKKQLSEQEIVETMLASLTEEQREALSKIIQSGTIK